jgi:hypothetical protein
MINLDNGSYYLYTICPEWLSGYNIMVGQRSPTEEYVRISIEEAIKRLSTDPKTGLSIESIKERIHRTGYNEVPEKKQALYLTF